MRRKLPTALLALCLLPLCVAAQTGDLIQTSSPSGILSLTTNSLAIPAQVTTATAPLSSAGVRFTHWTLDGQRPPDGPLGRAVNPVTFSMTQTVTAIAHYLPDTQDGDADGVADWFEVLLTGSTAIAAGANDDADAFTFKEEYHRDTHPQVPDLPHDGGLSWGDGVGVVLTDPAFARYAERTSPAGLHEADAIVAIGSTQSVPDVTGAHPEFTFAQWSANGVRLQDDRGRSTAGLSLMVTGDTTVTALFVPTAQDSNTNDIPDWFEWNYLGAPSAAPPGDADADSLALRAEYHRDTHPGQRDTFAPGGVSWRDAPTVSISFQGLVRYAFTSDPAGWVDQSGQAPTGTLISTAFLSGEQDDYTFAQWSLGGVRQTDAYGVPLNQLHITLLSNVSAVATYRPTDQDSNGDSIPDWVEIATFGVVTNAAESDADADGLSFLDEFRRHTNPHLADTIQRGGISWRGDDAPVNLRLLGPDSDGDEMPDWWEELYFQTLARTGTNSFDSDPLTDLQEWIAFSNPTNAADALALSAIRSDPAGAVIEWSTAPGRWYVLETNTNLLLESWTPLHTTSGDGWIYAYTNPSPGAVRFYRLGVSLP